MPRLVLSTPLGDVALQLLADAAPATAAHVARLARAGVYDGASFYRSDFVIQFGLHGTAVKSPFPPLSVNESRLPTRLSNLRGTCAVAHFDVPDCGDSEAFISLQDNAHLDAAYGGARTTQNMTDCPQRPPLTPDSNNLLSPNPLFIRVCSTPSSLACCRATRPRGAPWTPSRRPSNVARRRPSRAPRSSMTKPAREAAARAAAAARPGNGYKPLCQ